MKYWKENYEWWLKMYEKFELNSGPGDFQPMMLEVRNNDWTDESIEDYKSLLDLMMEKRYEMCGNDTHKLMKHFFMDNRFIKPEDEVLPEAMNYDPLALYTYGEDILNEQVGCDLQKSIAINCTNLSLVLCHRLTYNLFTGGYFVLDENKEHIIDLKAHNIAAYLSIKNTKNSNLPICFSCQVKDFCMKGCFGSQYESSGEVLLPVENSCKMFREKIKYLIKLYNKYNLIREAICAGYLRDRKKDVILKLMREMGEEINLCN